MDDQREVWGPMVEQFLVNARSSRKEMRSTLGFLAQLLRKDQLPAVGREFIADWFEKIAAGANPGLPSQHKRTKFSPVAVFKMVELEKHKKGRRQANNDIYEAIGIRCGGRDPLKVDTVKTRASTGRSHVRKLMRGAVADGMPKAKVIELFERRLKLPAKVLEELF